MGHQFLITLVFAGLKKKKTSVVRRKSPTTHPLGSETSPRGASASFDSSFLASWKTKTSLGDGTFDKRWPYRDILYVYYILYIYVYILHIYIYVVYYVYIYIYVVYIYIYIWGFHKYGISKMDGL